MTDLKLQASRLKRKIRIANRRDYFYDAEKLEVELELINQKIESENVR